MSLYIAFGCHVFVMLYSLATEAGGGEKLSAESSLALPNFPLQPAAALPPLLYP